MSWLFGLILAAVVWTLVRNMTNDIYFRNRRNRRWRR